MTDIWQQYKESFDAYDLDGDGYITRADLDELESRLGRSGEFVEHLDKLWRFLAASLDTNRDQRVDLQEWYEAWREMREGADNYDSLPCWFRNYCDLIFSILDEDGDGHVVESEYERFLAVFGREALPGVFAELDSDKSGTVTTEQLQNAVYDFTCVHDERNVRFWGRPKVKA